MAVDIIDLLIAIVLSGITIAFLILIIRKKTVWFLIGGEILVSILLGLFNLWVSFGITIAVLIVSLCMSFYANLGEIRKYLTVSVNSYKNRASKYTSAEVGKNIDEIAKAVKWLVENKTGALITIERNDELDKYVNGGAVVLNAPVCAELIETIFYEGTVLHDGALIIRNGKIYMAACFYPMEESRNLPTKFGARHRAAYSISNITDSVNIVVSEETGSVHIVFSGMIEHVAIDEFPNVLKTLISNKAKLEGDGHNNISSDVK